jgi:hypothetical protein
MLTTRTFRPFNQMYKWNDIKVVGNCYAYTMLFFTYVYMHNLANKGLDVDYSAFIPVLNTFDPKKKHDVQSLQDKPEYCIQDVCVDHMKLLNNEIAILSQNSGGYYQSDFDEVVDDIAQSLRHFDAKVFYHVAEWNQNKFMGIIPASHIVGFYIPKFIFLIQTAGYL